MSDIGVHATHCCLEHGCKYGDDDCPVMMGTVDGLSAEECEHCIEDIKRFVEAFHRINAPRYASEERMVKTLGEKIGYGRMMQLAQKLWRQALIDQGYPPGGEFVSGPCKALTVECGCKSGCDWCEGSGWLTKKVKELKDSME